MSADGRLEALDWGLLATVGKDWRSSAIPGGVGLIAVGLSQARGLLNDDLLEPAIQVA